MEDDHTPILATLCIHFSVKVWENVLFELGSEKGAGLLIPTGGLAEGEDAGGQLYCVLHAW